MINVDYFSDLLNAYSCFVSLVFIENFLNRLYMVLNIATEICLFIGI
jgi:hypothetical protein